jgi:putative nucleotidyltransferase with HDIG domain
MPDAKPTLDHEQIPAKLGTEFITKFYRLLKGTTLYDRKSVVIDRLTQECLQVVHGILQWEGKFSLRIVRDHFFFNDTRIVASADKYPIFKAFWQAMRKRRIGGMKFSEGASGEHLDDLAYLFSGLEENEENNYLAVRKQLEHLNIRSIEVEKLEVSKDEEIDIDSEGQKKCSREVYFRSIGLAKEVVKSIHQQKPLPIRKAKRLMQNAANVVMRDDSTLLGLANIKNYDEYTFNHSVNVAVYAMALGQRIGIPPKHLSHLGMAGLFHDIGKTKIPEEILNKTERLSPEERSILRSHPVIGTELIARMTEWGELSTRMAEGAFEHHLRYDLTGYPRLAQKKKITLFGRVVSIADFYDALARPRGAPRFPYVSEKILEIMLVRSGRDFDPGIVKAFINMIGVFPLGTLALLNTHEMGIVTQIQEDSDLLDHPKVCLIYYSNGEYRKGNVVDLGERDEVSGDFRKSIVKTLDPNEYNINVAEFFM